MYIRNKFLITYIYSLYQVKLIEEVSNVPKLLAGLSGA
jgi:hypothetical protein